MASSLDALIAQGVRPPQVEDPTVQYARLQQIANMRQQQQLQQQQQQLQQQQMQAGQLDLQEKQMQLNQMHALNQAYSSALTTTPDGTADIDTSKLTTALGQSGAGSAIPTVLHNVQDYKKSSAELAEAQGKVAVLEADAAGALGASVRAADYDPNLFLTLAQHAVNARHVDAQAVAPLIGQVSQALQQDPTGAAAKQLTQRIADHLIAGSQKQRELDASAQSASARQQQAATGAEKQANEAPGQVADAAQKARANAAAQLGSATDAVSYTRRYDALAPELQKQFPAPEQYDPAKTPAIVRQLGMSADEQTQAAQAAANAGETKRHNQVEEGQGAQRVGVERERFNATIGAGLDANGQPVSPDALKSTAQQDPFAVAIAHYQAPPPTARSSPLAAATMRKVLAINPTYDATQWPVRSQTARDFSASGASGKLLTSADTALAHLNTISQAGEALRNNDFPALNRIANALGAQVGSSPKTTYDTIVSMVAPEISKAVIGAAGGEGERGVMAQNFNSSASPDQREKSIAAAVGLLSARVQKQAHAYESTMGKPLAWQLSPESQAVVKRYSPTPTALPAGAGKTIDKATAQQFYNAAGGDPAKARQMAIDNGWKVQ